ncbi:hypothetical protein ACHAXA_001882 [Cyclostephanos tholiformis]|jgi:hypothetical protein|uniref:Glycosyltransferase family 92 protein n=1 Tax=Cyclostephanos tholiformis TaxID=382380 RepID=A0ABD3RQQ1_9STRA
MAPQKKRKLWLSSSTFQLLLSLLFGCIVAIYSFDVPLLREIYASKGQHPTTDQRSFAPSHRDFLTEPITSLEDAALRASATSNITAAVCHPTLFGNITLNRILSFVSFYRLLGFGHIFFWYEEESLAWSPTSSFLGNLSYVTLSPNSHSQRGGYHGQNEVQHSCRTEAQFGASYDWVLVVDADEFLWLGPNVTTIQDFVVQTPHITYYSFGKWQYSTNRAISITEEDDAGFGLDNLPFTLGRYCYSRPNSYSCPDWQGRSKILSMPSRYPEAIGVHGSSDILSSRGHEAVHYDHHEAHIKEWPGVAEAPHGQSIRPLEFVSKRMTEMHLARGGVAQVKEPRTYTESKDVYLGVHWQAEAYPILPNGTLLLMYDDRLSTWFRSVAANLRCA